MSSSRWVTVHPDQAARGHGPFSFRSIGVGKSNNDLNCAPDNLINKIEVIKEKEAQLKEYKRLMKSKKTRITKEINELENILKGTYSKSVFTEKTRAYIKNTFMVRLDIETLKDNMEKACAKISDDANEAYRYFCGICWNQIKKKGRKYG